MIIRERRLFFWFLIYGKRCPPRPYDGVMNRQVGEWYGRQKTVRTQTPTSWTRSGFSSSVGRRRPVCSRRPLPKKTLQLGSVPSFGAEEAHGRSSVLDSLDNQLDGAWDLECVCFPSLFRFPIAFFSEPTSEQKVGKNENRVQTVRTIEPLFKTTERRRPGWKTQPRTIYVTINVVIL